MQRRNLYAWILGFTAIVWLLGGVVAINYMMQTTPTKYEASPQLPK
jgi:hypothetical protein